MAFGEVVIHRDDPQRMAKIRALPGAWSRSEWITDQDIEEHFRENETLRCAYSTALPEPRFRDLVGSRR